MNSNGGTIDIQEMLWGAVAPNFTLQDPSPLDVPQGPAAGGLRLAALGRPGGGRHVVFRITAPEAMDGRLELFDVSGRRLRTIRTGPLPAGDSFAEWDGRANGAGSVPHGVFFARLATRSGDRVVRLAVAD